MMKQFVSCKRIGKGDETILLNLDYVKFVYRYFREERGDIVEDKDGNIYACYLPIFENGELVGYNEDFDNCIKTVHFAGFDIKLRQEW